MASPAAESLGAGDVNHHGLGRCRRAGRRAAGPGLGEDLVRAGRARPARVLVARADPGVLAPGGGRWLLAAATGARASWPTTCVTGRARPGCSTSRGSPGTRRT